jgi:hypothetical protein
MQRSGQTLERRIYATAKNCVLPGASNAQLRIGRRWNWLENPQFSSRIAQNNTVLFCQAKKVLF